MNDSPLVQYETLPPTDINLSGGEIQMCVCSVSLWAIGSSASAVLVIPCPLAFGTFYPNFYPYYGKLL